MSIQKNRDLVLSEAKRLHGLGLGILWLHPKSKRPVGMGWTTGARQEWPELLSSYTPGMNVGVRTGEASRFPGTPDKAGKGCDSFLACIDVDVKDEGHKKAAYAALQVLLEENGVSETPKVASGRGGGSCHLYCRTPSPFKMITVAKHPAWEICVYSTGRQMVLPPSIHPDTGKAYKWLTPLAAPADLPLMDFSEWENAEPERPTSPTKKKQRDNDSDPSFDFKCDDTLDIRWLPGISDATRNLIVKGVWKGRIVEDRSAYLLVAATALVNAGLPRDSVLTALTDPTTFLGRVAYEHAGGTKERRRAARWLWGYSVKKAVRERDPRAAFQGVPFDEPGKASAEEGSEQEEEWRDRPEDNGFYASGARGALKPNYDALLSRFVQEHPYRTIADMKCVYIFNGTHYADFTPIEAKGYAERMMDPKPDDKTRNEFYSKILANHIARRSFFIDSTEGWVNFKNGMLDLSREDVELVAHSEERGFRGVLPYDFDPNAKCPVFKEWLSGIMLADIELQSILQEYMGYIVRGGDYKYHKALWLGGVGRNGKSTFIDVLKALIGAGNFSVLSIRSLVNDKFASADLDGKIANFSEETSPKELSDSGPFKNLTGDGDIYAQKKYGDPYNFRNRAKLIMTYNQIPDISDLSVGMLSRPIIIPFEKVISEADQDQGIKQKLFAELPGIFNFALRGWRRLERRGAFTRSEKSDLALKAVKEESCSVFQWAESRLRTVPGVTEYEKEKSYEAWQIYRIYQNTEKHPYRASEFFRRFNVHPLARERRKRVTKGTVYWGVKIL